MSFFKGKNADVLNQGLPSVAMSGLGGLISGLFGGGGLMGKKEHFMQQPLYAPQQMQGLDFLTQQGMKNANWDDISNAEENRFRTQTIPGLAERFTNMGGGAQSSSGFQDALSRAGAGLHTDLAGMRSQFGLQQLGLGLRPQYENIFRPRQPGGLEQGLAGMSNSIMNLFPLLNLL
jgi:hypothetical protein